MWLALPLDLTMAIIIWKTQEKLKILAMPEVTLLCDFNEYLSIDENLI